MLPEEFLAKFPGSLGSVATMVIVDCKLVVGKVIRAAYVAVLCPMSKLMVYVLL